MLRSGLSRATAPAMAGLSILNGAFVPLPEPGLLHKLFELAVESGDPAYNHGVWEGSAWTSYAALNAKANSAARRIGSRLQLYYGSGVMAGRRDWVLAIDIRASERLLVAMLAALKLGCAYMPIDSDTAINRVRYILKETQPLCIVCDEHSAFLKDDGKVWQGHMIIDFEEVYEVKADICEQNLLDSELVGNGHLLTVIYTSGSTGKPKGVKLCHKVALNRLNWQWRELPFRADEVSCFKCSPLFVDSVNEIFGAVLKLVPLVIAPPGVVTDPQKFIEFVAQYGITRLVMVPSLMRSLLYYRDHPKRLYLYICNSESLPPSLAEQFFDHYPTGKTFVNLYGSTETMGDVTCQIFHNKLDVITKTFEGQLSIGLPMYNTVLYIVGPNGEIMPLGEVGEICITGCNLSDGYIGDAASSGFGNNPYDYAPLHSVLYHTGDFGRVQLGVAVYEGRRDMQIKIRGQRVNISEIERLIQGCDDVIKAVVLCHRFSEISSVITAYYTTEKGEADSDIEARMEEACNQGLPVYMRPKLLWVKEIPLQRHSGKVDQVKLRRLYEKSFNRQSSEELASRETPASKALTIMAMSLSLPPEAVDVKKSFFEQGGNSVSMIATIVKLQKHDMNISIESFSKFPSIGQIIDHVTEKPAPNGGKFGPASKYQVMPLHDAWNSSDLIPVFTESFVAKEPLTLLLGVTEDEFTTFAQSLFSLASRDPQLSLIVVERASQRVVGGDFLFDFHAPLDVEHHPSMEPILQLLHEFEQPVKDMLDSSGHGPLLFNYCLCVDKDLPHAEQVEICTLIEENVLQVAQRNSFTGVLTNNTNPATQDICEHFFGYQLLARILVRDFELHGRKVFHHAAEDYYCKMMIKFF